MGCGGRGRRASRRRERKGPPPVLRAGYSRDSPDGFARPVPGARPLAKPRPGRPPRGGLRAETPADPENRRNGRHSTGPTVAIPVRRAGPPAFTVASGSRVRPAAPVVTTEPHTLEFPAPRRHGRTASDLDIEPLPPP